MELSISEVKLSELNLANRIDAEHYQPHFLGIVNSVKNKQYKKLSELVSKNITTGHTPSMKEESFYGGDVKFIKTDNLRDNQIVENFNHYLSDKGANKLKNASLKNDDIIVTIIGATFEVVGRVARIFPDLGKASINQNISLIRPTIASGYLTCFLMCKYGKQQLYYLSRQTEQVNLNNVEVGDVLVPIASDSFVNKIHSLHTQTHDLTVQSKKLYQDAENMLLKELGLGTHTPNEEGLSVRELSECLRDNRFDAEYWQPEYDEVIKKINSYKLGASIIGAEFKQLKGSFKAQAKQEYKYVEIGDVNVSTGEVDSNTVIAEELPANAKILLRERQLVTSKVRPNRGATAILDNHEGYIGSGAFVVIQEKQSINLETLMVYLKLQPIKDLLLRYNTGTSYPTITDDDVLKLPIPLIDKKVQEKISELLITSKKQRLEAKELLSKAKYAVEVFIEKDEVSALKILN